MFYSEDLLGKTGPLARVWLAANVEKKLSKAQVLQDKIVDDISVILKPQEYVGGPLALRANGTLLLGVVRIYSRKARYLLDDCNEALIKIKMAFKPGDINLPSNQSHIANPASLTLPDVLTEIDLLAPMPDPSLLLSQHMFDLGGATTMEDATIPDWDQSQFLSGSIEQPRLEPMALDEADDLNLDLGDDLDEPFDAFDDGTSIERGRNAPLERRLSEQLRSSPKPLEEEDLGLDFGEDLDESAMPPAAEVNMDLDLDMDGDIDMGGATELGANIGADETGVPTFEDMEALPPRERDSASPLSELRASVERELEQTYLEGQTTTIFEPQDDEDESLHHEQRVKRRKVLPHDSNTELSSKQIRQLQSDHSKIMKPAAFLPRDPVLLALMNMQKSGAFVSSILGDGRSRGWAPELRGILSMEIIARPQKRKRDSGVADLETEEDEEAVAGAEKTPQLEFDPAQPELDELSVNLGGGDITIGQDDEMIRLPSDAGIVLDEDLEEEEEDVYSPVPDHFDDTTAPLLHPAEAGPISLGTTHAVHVLRDQFGSEAEHDESQRRNASIVFQDMFPYATTTRADATQMFFEVLVLATKDAIKVEQEPDELGGPLRIRGKRGLWGAWAETSAGGGLAAQNAPEGAAEGAPEAGPSVAVAA
ncbi:hypothetical protein P154DRAFT_479047 [Amniculicola lignicola CBS 123094]|uniref:Double-strand-break repair protein rad21 n=1 Tax=Amniculicola lignicola CBS 123094 TaxID=1392246 RepID=A0A6A5X4B1_9PLEO|nr:hypothetical protein P154DRAFT_479047 [Amniculicola lignicola CBS 123094]